MYNKTKRRIVDLLLPYKRDDTAGIVAVAEASEEALIAVVGDAARAFQLMSKLLVHMLDHPSITEEEQRDCLVNIVENAYTELLHHRKEKADEANDQGQPGQ